MRHYFLSPHPDDAVFSCGGLIYQLAQAGGSVSVFTVMAGDLPPDATITPFVKEHFTRWGLAPDPVPGRKLEDQRALDILGGTVRFGPLPDALFRTDGLGTNLYPDLAALFGSVHPADPALSQAHLITAGLDETVTVYAPLGAGNHVDHQLVRDAVRVWQQKNARLAVFYYEEYPYSAGGTAVIEAARARLDGLSTAIRFYLDQSAMAAKIEAIMQYESQLSTFWKDGAAMGGAVRRYATQMGAGRYAERLWKLA